MKTGKSFKSMGLSDEVLKAIDKLGFRHPTPVQRQAIPSILTGVDAVALARTGSGKTAAFAIPTVNRLVKHSEIVGARAIVLSPTRELAMQTCKVFQLLSRFTDLRIALIVGGHSMDGQFDRLLNNPDIIIATPGRLVHHLDQGAGFSLGKVEMLVLDEADRLFELGFADQIQSILKSCPQNRQALLFSATLPTQLVQFAKIGLTNPEFIRLDSECALSDNLQISMAFTRNEAKPAALMSVLRALRADPSVPDSIGKTIVFVATRHHVDFIGQLVSKCSMGSLTTIYGSMEQQVRSNSLNRFRTGAAKILIVTDVAARGLDIPDVDNIIHYDFPSSPKLFIHRTGRTARNGKSGRCIAMVTQSDMPYVFDLMMFIGSELVRGRRQSIVPGGGEITIEDGTAHLTVEIGGIPYIDDDVEMVDRILAQDTDLESAKKSMEFAMQPYFKTRPAASRQAVKHSREYLEGGRQQEILADFLSIFGKRDDGDDTIMNQLRNFRPSAYGNLGAVVKADTRKSLEDKVFGSIRARELALSILSSETTDTTNDKDDGSLRRPKRDFKSKMFYHEENTRATEDQDEFEQHRMDIVPETREEISKAHIAKKWDKKKMKYVGVRIGADGNAIVGTKRNESGVKLSKKGKNLYEDWAKRTKKQIQKIGEVENVSVYQKHQDERRRGERVAKVDDGRSGGEGPQRKVNSKEYHGEIPWGYLTNKQKRLEGRKMACQGVVTSRGGERSASCLKSTSAIAKERNLKNTRKILQDKKKRKEFHKQSNEAYLARQRNKTGGARSRCWQKINRGRN